MDADTFDPELFTLAQEVSLYASNCSWRDYRVTVPGSAKRIAIVNVCRNNSTYSTTNNTVGIDRISVKSMLPEVLGYNVYENLLRHNTSPVEGTSYTIDYNAAGTSSMMREPGVTLPTYHVTALYAEGESALSDVHTPSISTGIGTLEGSKIEITILPGST